MKTMKYMQQLFLTVALVAGFTACSSEEDFVTTSTSEITDVNITIGAFPTFSENAVSRAIGTEDPGKTAWTSGDVVLLKTTFFSDAEKSTQLNTATNELTFDGSKWTLNSKIYWQEDAASATIVAWYAPNYELNQNGILTLKSGKTAGTCELLTSEEIGVTKENMTATIAFQGRTYNRLRVATDSGRTLMITSEAFTANDGTTPATDGLTVTADAQGNIFLYGTWTSDAKMAVKVEDNGKAYTLVEKTMPTTAAGNSYAVDVIMNTVTDCTKWGSGTTEAPYLIANAAQLADIATKVNTSYYWNKSFLQIADIDLSSVCSEASNLSWTAIGTASNLFCGTFDGNNHTISRLYLNSTEKYQGLFGRTENTAIVKNVRLASGSVHGKNYVGGIVGSNSGGSVVDCSNTGNVISDGYAVGGIVGNNNGSVAGCSNMGNVTSNENSVGGIVGDNGGFVAGCSNTGNVTSSSFYIGGIVGFGSGCIIGCSNTGDITSSGTVGGIVGDINQNGGDMVGCYVTGTVKSTSSATYIYIGSVAGILYSCKLNSVYYVAQNGVNYYGNNRGSTFTDVTAKTLDEMNSTATVSNLNTAIAAWNTANADKQCNYHFEAGTGTATLPVIVEGAPL